MSGVDKYGRDLPGTREYNPQGIKDNQMPVIHEMQELEFDSNGKPIGESDQQDRVQKKGVRLPRGKTVKPDEMGKMLDNERIEDEAALKNAGLKSNAEKPALKADPKPRIFSRPQEVEPFDVLLRKKDAELKKVGALPRAPEADSTPSGSGNKKKLGPRKPSS